MKNWYSVLLLLKSVMLGVDPSPVFISDDQYSTMPELFLMENFDRCLLSNNGLFCSFVYKLSPLNSSDLLWQIIKNVSEYPQNYRHDLLRHGLCVSEKCKIFNEETSSLEKCYSKIFLKHGLRGNVSDVVCESKISKYAITGYDITIGVALIGYAILVIAASLYEGLARYGDKELYVSKCEIGVGVFISAFSIPKNWYRLRSVNKNPEVQKLKAIQGMRFYNMICVVMTHTLMAFFAGPVANPKYLEQSTQKILNMFLANGWYAVQTFFVISGWLLSYNFFKIMEKKSSLHTNLVCAAILNRILRLIPPLIFMIAIHTTFLVHIGRGPNWDIFVGEEYRNCRANWWTNLLFLNNYINKNNMCMQQTWYIAADMQLFILYFFVLCLTWKLSNHRMLILYSMLCAGLLVPGILAFVNQYDIIVRQYPETLYKLNLLKLDHWHDLYSSGYSNLFGYGIGVAFGYAFYKTQNKELPVKKVHVFFWWILTFGMCIFVILIAVIFYNPDFSFSPLGSALYWALGKNLFALGIAIGIFGFTQKIGWFARSMCEWGPVQILGRLTYSTYIVHATVSKIHLGYRRYPVTLNDNLMFVAVLGDISLAYLLGLVMCLMVEMPISALQKLLNTPTRGKNQLREERPLDVISDISTKEGG